MKNKNKIVVVGGVVLLLVVFFFLGYVACNKNWFKQEVNNNAEKNTKVENEYNLSEVKNSLANYEYLFDTAHSLDEVSKEKIYTAIFNNIYKREKKNVTLDEFNTEYKKTIFNNIKIDPQDIGFDTSCMDLIQYKYNSSTKTFEYNELPGHDCSFGSYPVVANRGVYDYKKNNNSYVLTEYIIFSHPTPEEDMQQGIRKYYRTYEDATNGANVLFEQQKSIDPFDNTNSKYSEYTDQLQKVMYTFEEKNGVLTLVDYKIA